MSDEPTEKRPRSRAGRGKKKREPRPRAPRAPSAPSPPGRERGARFVLGGPLKWTLTVLFSVIAAGMTLFFVVYPERPGPSVGREVELELLGDESPDALAARLETAGVLTYPRLFAIYVRVRGAAGTVAKGPHLLADDLTPRELLARLSRRAGAKAKLTIPEGFTRVDIAKRLHAARICSRKSFLDATADRALLASLRVDGPTVEGYLFPATYELPQDSLPADVVRRMKLEFDKRYAALEERHGVGINDLQSSLQWGRREIVTLASMVEKEAGVDDERPLIAGVFLNRLRDPKFTPKLLQSDPTAAYGCVIDPLLPSCRAFTGKITHSLLTDATNMYNTYKHVGLPPGPIANPGARSLEAVMAPATTRALYFVAKGGGRHYFSETYEAHQAAIKGKAPPPPSEVGVTAAEVDAGR